MKIKSELERISMDSICDIISRSTKMHPEKVRDVFQEYEKLWLYAVKNKQRLSLGTIGEFCFDFRRGKKAGTEMTRFLSSKEASKPLEYRGEREFERYKLEEDTPDYMRSIFEVYPSKQRTVREITSVKQYGKKTK